MNPKNTSIILLKLRQAMLNTKHVAEILDAYIIPCQDAHQSEYVANCDKRIEFISGFTGSRALVVVTQNEAKLWTDGRYFVQANEQIDDNWELMREGIKGIQTMDTWLGAQILAGGVVGVDPRLISADRFGKLSKTLQTKDISLTAVSENLVDLVWGDDRPKEPANSVQILPVKFTGRSWQNKVADIRQEMESYNVKLLVLSALDEIAWTLNLRGSDIPYNTVFFAYLIIGLDFVSLFIDERKLSDQLLVHLNATPNEHFVSNDQSVQLYPYSSVCDYLSKYQHTVLTEPSDKVWLPAESTNKAVASVVAKTRRFVAKMSPVAMRKAVKNGTELAGIRSAHIKDAVALCEFLLWLETAMKRPGSTEKLTEKSVADRLEQLRAQQDDYVSESFETISAVGSHAASPHYQVNESSNCELARNRIFLIDSGGHYRDGTTDVTRTLCFDDPTSYQKKCFTLVLKGHIQLAIQKFPEQTNGMRLDTLSRMALWNVGLDYQHGTGHGVGHYLNVHEGPAGIGYRNPSPEGILENMVLTIEPGYYDEEQEFGIRIEIVYAVVACHTEYKMSNARFLTFDPVTFVPIQKKFLDPALLSSEELTWLNDYHDNCLDKVGPILESQGKRDVLNWLREQCKPLG